MLIFLFLKPHARVPQRADPMLTRVRPRRKVLYLPMMSVVNSELTSPFREGVYKDRLAVSAEPAAEGGANTIHDAV